MSDRSATCRCNWRIEPRIVFEAFDQWRGRGIRTWLRRPCRGGDDLPDVGHLGRATHEIECAGTPCEVARFLVHRHGREEHDRHAAKTRVAARELAEVGAVDGGQEHIGDNDVRTLLPHGRQRRSPIAARRDGEAHPLEALSLDPQLYVVIVHQQHAQRRPARGMSTSRSTQVRADHLHDPRWLGWFHQHVVESSRRNVPFFDRREKPGECDDGHALGAGESAQLCHEIEPAHVREHDILENQIGHFRRRALDGAGTGVRFQRTVPFARQRDTHHLARDRIVFDDENSRAHGRSRYDAMTSGRVRVSIGFAI